MLKERSRCICCEGCRTLRSSILSWSCSGYASQTWSCMNWKGKLWSWGRSRREGRRYLDRQQIGWAWSANSEKSLLHAAQTRFEQSSFFQFRLFVILEKKQSSPRNIRRTCNWYSSNPKRAHTRECHSNVDFFATIWPDMFHWATSCTCWCLPHSIGWQRQVHWMANRPSWRRWYHIRSYHLVGLQESLLLGCHTK